MSDPVSKAELMRSLGRLVRGLSSLFWGLPLTLVIAVQTAKTDWLRPFGLFPPLLTASLLFYGVLQLGHFQKQERLWSRALERTKLLGLINIGLSPFLFWWHRLPGVDYFAWGVGVFTASSLLFVFNLNYVLERLAAMLPDETLRHDTRLFTLLNRYLLMITTACVALAWCAVYVVPDSGFVAIFQIILERGTQWMLVFLVLLPVAITMALIWKIKEIILASVFGQDS